MRHCESSAETKGHGAVASIVGSCLTVGFISSDRIVRNRAGAINYKFTRASVICKNIAAYDKHRIFANYSPVFPRRSNAIGFQRLSINKQCN